MLVFCFNFLTKQTKSKWLTLICSRFNRSHFDLSRQISLYRGLCWSRLRSVWRRNSCRASEQQFTARYWLPGRHSLVPRQSPWHPNTCQPPEFSWIPRRAASPTHTKKHKRLKMTQLRSVYAIGKTYESRQLPPIWDRGGGNFQARGNF